MADNLESYFKKHLSDETPAEDNWNVPSDDVWNKAAPHIIKKSGLFIRWRYIYIIGALLVAGLIYILWPSTDPGMYTAPDISTTTEKIAPPISEPSNTKPSSKEQTSHEPAEANATYQEPSTLDASTSTKHSTSGIPPATPINKNISNADLDETPPESLTAVYTIEQSISTAAMDPSSIYLPSREVNSLNITFPRNLPDTIPRTYPAIHLLSSKPKPEPFNNKNRFAIGAYFLPSYNSTYVSGELSAGEIETGNTFLYSSNWGVEIKYFISNRITLVAGIERSEIKSWSQSFVDFSYDASTEHTMPEGDKENTSPVPMQTPFGEIGTQITYRFPGEQSISDGEMMQSSMETHQEILYFSIPLGIEYNYIRFSRVNLLGEGGLRYNQALQDGTSYTSRILHNGHDMDVVNEVMTGHPNYTKNYLSFYIGTGASWQVSKSLQFSGSARYFGNITKVNFQDQLSTYVHGFNLKLGIIYIF